MDVVFEHAGTLEITPSAATVLLRILRKAARRQQLNIDDSDPSEPLCLSSIMKRFAFYGRVSTEDQQDPTSSRNWQLARSRQVIESVSGEIVEEFFDIGQSRSLPWKRRPEALRLLAAFREPERGFDAVVIGEPQRAFYGNQFGLTFPVFVHYGIELWVPEVGGKVDPGSDAHDLVMSLYGGMSKGERNRIKTRVRAAMTAQAAIEGRFLGGRPPYGYVIGDAGPHPNPGRAAAGQRLHALELDPVAAPVVQRIYEEFIAGSGLHAIAEKLTAGGIPSPSAHDPARNRHRIGSGGAWSKHATRAILRNPRYTGRQVWNRQRRDEILIDVEDVALGHESKMRWNDESEWVRSQHLTQTPIVSVDTFDAAQQIFAAGQRAPVRKERTRHPYVLSGLMRCGLCRRKMQASWNNGQAYYRCKFPAEHAVAEDKHAKTVYVREDVVVPGLDAWIAGLFDDEHLDATCAALAAASDTEPEMHQDREVGLRRQIKDCDAKLTKYRALLEQQPDITTVGSWIAEVERERKRLERELGRKPTTHKLTTNEIKALVGQLKDIVAVLANASPEDKRAIYDELGLNLTYHPETKMVRAGAGAPHVLRVGVGGTTQMVTPRAATVGLLDVAA
ncbi:MAG TPA: recombinase family protein [Ilumatobacter sp.]|nr:recombinase family protein [Ilumatobacter sp.]